MQAPFRTQWNPRALQGALGGNAFGRDFTIQLQNPAYFDPRPVAFHGVEALNELYTFHVLLSVEAVASGLAVSTLLGTRVTLTIPHQPDSRAVHGIIARADSLAASFERSTYSIEIVPALWLLGKTKESRVYQAMTVEEIVDEVLTRHKIPHIFSLSGQYPKRENCLQYKESDLAFVERLLREEGFLLGFDHPSSLASSLVSGAKELTECVVIGDNRAMYSAIPGSPLLVYKPEGHSGIVGSAGSDVHRFSPRAAIEPTRETLRDFEFELATAVAGLTNPTSPTSLAGTVVLGGTKTTVLEGPPTEGVEPLEVYDHDVEEPLRRGTKELAKVRLEQLRTSADSFVASSFVRRLSPGRTFHLLDHPQQDPRAEVCITRVEHRGHDLGDFLTEPRYVNDFEGVPSTVLFRPPAADPRLVEVIESGIVVGPAGQEIETDGYGRVRVQFHWDRLGKNDEKSSCWMRVMQAWSGPSYGFQFIPRIGAEVLVSFLGGNPDHPVIIGCMPSTFDKLPHLLPDDKTRSAIRTRTTPAVTGGYNEIQFDDQAGSELLALRAERDMEEHILHDQRVSIGNENDLQVGANRSTRVGISDNLIVGAHSQRTVGGNAVDLVAGGKVTSVGADSIERVTHNYSLSVGQSSAVKIAGPSTIVVGEDAETECLQSVFGEHRLSGSKLLELRSATRIRFAVGTTLIELLPDGIHIEADKIDTFVKNKTTTRADTAEILTKTLVELTSKEVKATSKGASMVLNSDASLDGGNVLLNCGGIKGPDPDAPPDRPTGKVIFQVEPPAGMKGPFTVLVSTPDGQVVEKTTDGSNQVSLEGEQGEKFTVVEVRKDGEPLHKPSK